VDPLKESVDRRRSEVPGVRRLLACPDEDFCDSAIGSDNLWAWNSIPSGARTQRTVSIPLVYNCSEIFIKFGPAYS
jgi:hypothetical protein